MELFKLFGTIAIENDEANARINETTENASGAGDKISSALKKVGGIVATAFAVEKIKDFGAGCINAAADASAMTSQFSQVFGELESTASTNLTAIAENTGIVENRLKGSYTQIAAFAKTGGMETAEALNLADRAMVAVADSAAFYDRSLEETTESLQSFLKGNYENDAALGLSCTETTRNAAANELYGKSFNELSEAQKQLTLLQMVEDANKLSGAMGQASRESDTWTNQTGNLKQAWTDFQAVIGERFLPTAVSVVTKMQERCVWMTQNQGIVIALASAVGVLAGAVGLYNAVQAVKAAMNAAEVTSLTALIAAKWADVAATMAMLAPYALIVAAIAAVIAIIVVCVQHWDQIKAKAVEVAQKIKTDWQLFVADMKVFFSDLMNAASNAWNSIKSTAVSVWEGIRSAIQSKVEALKNFLSDAWNSIKSTAQSAFSTLKSVLTNPFETAWNVISGIINKIKSAVSSVKSSAAGLSFGGVSIAPHAAGGILTKPTIFGYTPSTGTYHLGGEAGPEAIAPIGVLQGYVAAAVASQNAGIANAINNLAVAINDMDQNMGKNLKNALDGTKLSVNNREFARMVKGVT